jgi:hypothetical protein
VEKKFVRNGVARAIEQVERMNDQQHALLSLLAQPPARLTVEQVAYVLNCQPHDVPVLVAARLLKPLGSPADNCAKYFPAVEIIELARDRGWLGKMTNAVYQHWRTKNGNRHCGGRKFMTGEENAINNATAAA